MARSKNRDLKLLFREGFAIHHAGMLRSDRSMVEEFFRKGLIQVCVDCGLYCICIMFVCVFLHDKLTHNNNNNNNNNHHNNNNNNNNK